MKFAGVICERDDVAIANENGAGIPSFKHIRYLFEYANRIFDELGGDDREVLVERLGLGFDELGALVHVRGRLYVRGDNHWLAIGDWEDVHIGGDYIAIWSEHGPGGAHTMIEAELLPWFRWHDVVGGVVAWLDEQREALQ